MPLDLIIGSIAISYAANNIPSLRAIWDKYKGIDGHIDKCFEAAKKEFFPNKAIWDKLPSYYSSFSSFGSYLASCNHEDTEAVGFMNVLENEFKRDNLCSNLLLNWKLDGVRNQFNEYKRSTQTRLKNFKEVSSNLCSVNRNLKGRYHIDRPETGELLDWVCSVDITNDYLDRIAVVTGEAGCGKTVVLADLVEALELQGTPVIGLKADYLFDSTETDIDKAVNIGGRSLLGALEESASYGLTVLVIDQVDALSLSLTSRRKPLAEVQRVIQSASSNPNVRVVFSCREYDFHNERNFDRYETAKRFLVRRLSRERIIQALNELGIPTEGLSEEVFGFLEIPLNLSLFCRFFDSVSDNKVPSYHSLYDAFWRYVLVERPIETEVNTSRLVAYLTELTNRMVAQQVLTIGSNVMGAIWDKEQSFLISCGFLNLNADKTRLQFFHQTLFDYTVARLFIENNTSIDKSFVGIHQGLFLRGRLKRILEYLRGVSEDNYLKSLCSVLGIGSSKEAYRFHLKCLVVTLLGSYQRLLPGEVEIIRNTILKDVVLSKTFARSVIEIEPIQVLDKAIKESGGYNICSEFFAERIFNLLPYLYSKDRVLFYQLVNEIIKSGLTGNRKSFFLRVFEGLNIASVADINELWPVIIQLDDVPEDLAFEHFYKNAAKYSPDLAIDRMHRYLEAVVEKWSTGKEHIWNFDISHGAEEVLSSLKKYHPWEFLLLGNKMIDFLLATSHEGAEGELKTSIFYYTYNRSNAAYRFADRLLNNVLDVVEAGVEASWEGMAAFLQGRSQSEYAIKHVIAIVGWLKAPERYKMDAYDYLISNITKEEHSSILKYYQIELYRAIIMLVDKECQRALVDTAMTVSPEWEKVVFKGRTSPNYSNTAIGKTKAQFLSTIPEDFLKKNYPSAWGDLQEIKRKGFVLQNEAPNRIQTMSGWSTLSDEQFDKMKASDYVKFAEKYNQDNSIDFYAPTRVGNAWAMRDRAKEKPEEFFEIYKTLLLNGKADLYYVSCALEALQEGGLGESQLTELYGLLIKAAGKDVNESPSEVVMDICRSLDYYVKNSKTAPSVLMNYVLQVAKDADDSEDDKESEIDYNTGINRVRGCAVEHLVRSAFMMPYREYIFTALEQIAGTASVATRCAALFQMAFLMNYDKERTLNLFLTMTSDYNINILRLPAHNVNPLNYLIRYDFERLIPYFQHCVAFKESHQANIIWLWIATMLEKPGAKELMYDMADASVEGRSKLIRCTQDYYRPQFQSLVEEVVRRYMTYDEKELGRSYDSQFDDFDKWPYNRVYPFLDDFFNAPVAKYCSHHLYDYMKKTARNDAKKVLSWLIMLYPKKRDADFEQGDILDVLYATYNRILVFDIIDKDLEKAMDLLDSFLMSSNEYLVGRIVRDLGNE